MILLKTDNPYIVTQGKLTQYVFEEDLWEFLEEYIFETGEHILLEEWYECFEEVTDWDELHDATADQINGKGLENFMKGLI
jgi:hypothetical protein